MGFIHLIAHTACFVRLLVCSKCRRFVSFLMLNVTGTFSSRMWKALAWAVVVALKVALKALRVSCPPNHFAASKLLVVSKTAPLFSLHAATILKSFSGGVLVTVKVRFCVSLLA